jgi:hypothetical protein
VVLTKEIANLAVIWTRLSRGLARTDDVRTLTRQSCSAFQEAAEGQQRTCAADAAPFMPQVSIPKLCCA